jgi:hypothetical protein
VGAAVGAVGDVIEPVATDFYAGFTEDGPSSAEVAREVIETSPEPSKLEPPSMAGFRSAPEKVEEEENLTVVQTAPSAEALADVQATDPESSIFDKKLEEIMKRSKSPIRTISTFLQGYGEGKFTGASKAMRAAEAQYDNMEMDLLKLQQANRISEQQFDINMQKIANEKEQLRIMEDRYITQGKNEAARVKATEKYYEVLASGQTTGLQQALLDAIVSYDGSTLYYTDLAAELGVDVTDIDKVKDQQAVQDAQSRIRENYRQRLLSGSRTNVSTGAGTNINTALPEGVTVTRQD